MLGNKPQLIQLSEILISGLLTYCGVIKTDGEDDEGILSMSYHWIAHRLGDYCTDIVYFKHKITSL